MKYDTIPTIRGMYLSDLFDMSLSVPSFFAQNNIITIGNIEAKINDMASNLTNFVKSNSPFVKDNVKQIIKNNGIQMIGGLVNVEIGLAIFNLFMFLLYIFKLIKILQL